MFETFSIVRLIGPQMASTLSHLRSVLLGHPVKWQAIGWWKIYSSTAIHYLYMIGVFSARRPQAGLLWVPASAKSLHAIDFPLEVGGSKPLWHAAHKHLTEWKREATWGHVTRVEFAEGKTMNLGFVLVPWKKALERTGKLFCSLI